MKVAVFGIGYVSKILKAVDTTNIQQKQKLFEYIQRHFCSNILVKLKDKVFGV